jgi:hypothetical protein
MTEDSFAEIDTTLRVAGAARERADLPHSPTTT